MPRTLAFHDRDRPVRGIANYLAVVGPETLWPGPTPYLGKVADGTPTTILLAENDGLEVPWMEPRDLAFGEMSFDLQHPHGISSPYRLPGAVMADGSVRTLKPGLSPAALRAMLTADGGGQLSDAEGQWQVIEDGRDREKR